MQPTAHSDVNQLLASLLSQTQKILGKKLVGLYLTGSLVIGDFDPELSDIDLVAAIASDLDEAEFRALDKMHDNVAAAHEQWRGRIEIINITLDALMTFKTKRSYIAVISPGEPFHYRDAGIDWLMNWYIVRERGVVLFGPSPKTIIAPTTKEEFIQATTDHALGWREYIKNVHMRGSQAYAILTMCRALYTARFGEQTSKLQAALWAQKELPEWSGTIQNALLWRQAWRENVLDHEATLPETRRFVYFVIDRLA